MKQKPRPAKAPLLDKLIISRMLLVALVLMATTLVVFARNIDQFSLAYAQAIAFSMLVAGQWLNAQTARSETKSVFLRMWRPNWLQLLAYALAFTLQALVLFGPLGELFGVPKIAFNDIWSPVLLVCGLVLLTGELHKLFTRKIKRASD